MNKFFVVILFVGCSVIGINTLYAQKFRNRKDGHSAKYNAKSQSIFPITFNYEKNGWYLEPGLTYTLNRPSPKKVNFGDSLFVTFKDRGGLRFAISGGRYRFIENSYLFRYLNYGIGYKWISGKEKYEAVLLKNGQEYQSKGTGKFSDHHVFGLIDFNAITDLNNNAFIQNTVGLNVDYQFGQSRSSSLGVNEKFGDGFIAQLHYKIGYGWKPNEKILIIPSAEIPIIGFAPGLPTPMLPYYNSNYLPLIINVRILFLRPKNDVCPPVYAPEDMPKDFPPNGQ